MEWNKACVITGAVGAWYPQGQKRLIRSLIHHGFPGDILTQEILMHDGSIKSRYFNPENPYTIKAAMLYEAMSLGYETILWLDCSIWAIKDITEFFAIINNSGAFVMESGYTARQTTNDFSRRYYGKTAEQLSRINELWSCIFGFDITNPIAKRFAEEFLTSMAAGVFNGSRHHDGQSQDPEFLFHRQDQTALTLSLDKVDVSKEIKPYQPWEFMQQDEKQITNNTYFLMRGM